MTHIDPGVALARRRAERDDLLRRAVDLLWLDARISAAWLFGSMGRGDHDDLSDIDLRIVVRPGPMEALARERREFAERVGDPLVVVEAPQNAPPGGAYLYVLYAGQAGPQVLDLSWEPQAGTDTPRDVRLLFDRRQPETGEEAAPLARREQERPEPAESQVAFFWAMLPVAAKYAARRDHDSANRMLSLLESTLLRVRELSGMAQPMPGLQGEPAGTIEILAALAEEMRAAMAVDSKVGGAVPPEAVAQGYAAMSLAQAMLDQT